MSRPAAFFDLDLTLIDANSAVLWAKHERRRGFISRSQMARAMLWTVLYHFSLVNMEKAYAAGVAAYKGAPRSDIEARTRAWFHTEVAPLLRPEAHEALHWHRAQGHPLVLLTSSTCFGAKAAADLWGFDAWMANDFHHDENECLVGTFHEPLVYGAGKVHHARHYAETHSVSLDESYFYSDSYSDLPMLEAVGHPRVVTPDPRLRYAAKQRGWPVLQWRKP